VGHEGDPDFRQRFERKARAISGNIMLTKSEAKLLDFEHGTEVSPEVKLPWRKWSGKSPPSTAFH